MSWINHRAVNWAREYETHSPAERAVLFEFALHADERGYTYPSAVGIASRWHHDDETITGAISALLVRRAFCRTKKRRGKTGRLIVYRLPKITWEIPRQSANSIRGKITGKLPGNHREIPRQSATNKEQGTKNNPEKRTKGNSSPSFGNGPMAAAVSAIFSSFPGLKPEPLWWEEARQLYPHPDIEDHLQRIEASARRKKVEPERMRAYGLACLTKRPPGTPSKRKIAYRAELEASIARADIDNGLSSNAA